MIVESVLWGSKGLVNRRLLKCQIDRNGNFTWGDQVYALGQTVWRQLGRSWSTLPRTHKYMAPGGTERSSGLSFLGRPTRSHSWQKKLISFAFAQGSWHVSWRLRQTSQSSNLQPGHSGFNLRKRYLHLCRAELLNSLSMFQMIGPEYNFHSL